MRHGELVFERLKHLQKQKKSAAKVLWWTDLPGTPNNQFFVVSTG